MPFSLPLQDAEKLFPEYKFLAALTPSAHKAAFHVKDRDGNSLCLKIVSPAFSRERLDREILAMQAIAHPNVVRLIEYTFSSKPGQQRHYIIEEFVDGDDFENHLKGTPWGLGKAAEFFARLCDGLMELRKGSIVHRDFKPQNIRVRPNGHPVIIDFGLARHLSLPDLTLSVAGTGIGTPAYFAPEQFDGRREDIDHRTDLFALGIMLYETVTGVPPFLTSPTMTIGELHSAVCGVGIAHLQTPAFAALEQGARLLLSKLLERQRSRRPADAAQVASILRKLGAMAKP